MKCFVDILMFRIVRFPHGKTALWTAAQGKNRPHLLPGDHAGAPGNGGKGEMLRFIRRRETSHRWPYMSSLRQTYHPLVYKKGGTQFTTLPLYFAPPVLLKRGV